MTSSAEFTSTSSPVIIKSTDDTSSNKNDPPKSIGAGLQKSLSRTGLAPKQSYSGTGTPIGPPTPAGAMTPAVFSFDEPFEYTAGRTGPVDPEALKQKIDHVHDGGLEGGFHHGDDHEHDEEAQASA